ncbi:hypothetical protein CGMCC3_g6147 [Colletotrichum fructicola]|nr:uncharacterized protein CGMCC3_g6147 [Colletotrichum fructicola]KAE9577650.1 hypothetical protein CGMCC3_g6147 [Colletotrichum fructicola]
MSIAGQSGWAVRIIKGENGFILDHLPLPTDVPQHLRQLPLRNQLDI